MTQVIAGLNQELESLVGEARLSLVEVAPSDRGAGAGVVLHRRGLIVTNSHVVKDRTLRVILPDGREVAAELVVASQALDLALLRTQADDLIPLHMGNSASLRPGQWVVSLGHPWGVKGAAVGGAITSLDGRPGFLGPGPPLLELGLPLRPGHSGGPVLDVAGRLVGINTMIAGPERSFAIPVNAVKRLLQQVLA